MAIAFESISTQALATGSSTTITKPTGLTVGEEMIAVIASFGTTTNLTTPSGWTAYYNAVYSDGSSNFAYSIFHKTADSSDVAASNFTFSGGAGFFMGGSILRVSGFGALDTNASVTAVNDGTSPSSFATTITPTKANTLNLAVLWGGFNINAGSAVTFSNFAIATNNPTWTSRASLNRNVSATYGMQILTASRPETTSWGNGSFNFTGPAGSDYVATMLVFAPRVDGSHSVSTATHYFVNQPFLRNGEINIVGNDPTTSKMSTTQWSNDNKPSTNWTNPDK